MILSKLPVNYQFFKICFIKKIMKINNILYDQLKYYNNNRKIDMKDKNKIIHYINIILVLKL